MIRANNFMGIPTLINMGDFHLKMLLADEKTKSLAESFSPLQNRLKTEQQTVKDFEFSVAVTNAQIRNVDVTFDSLISQINAYVLAKSGNDRHSELYLSFFPNGRISEVVATPYDQIPEEIKRIQNTASNFPDTIPADYLTQLNEIAEKLNSLIQKLRMDTRELGEAKINLMLTKIPWIKQYNMNEAELLLLFESNKKITNNYFSKRKIRKHPELDEEPTLDDTNTL